MTCACIGNADDTAIVQACVLHDQWARARYGVDGFSRDGYPIGTGSAPQREDGKGKVTQR